MPGGIRLYRDTCAAVVQRCEGYLVRAVEDELLVYFGYPQAHENNARQAVCAGLAILQTLQQRGYQTMGPLRDGTWR